MRKVTRIVSRCGMGLIAFVLASLCAFAVHLVCPRNFDATGKDVTLHLKSGDLVCPIYFPHDSIKPNAASQAAASNARGIVVLATGDGGWSYWEDRTAHSLADHGLVVIGWDCRKFADSRTYSHQDLVNGFALAATTARQLVNHSDLPIWYAGWSTGAEQSLAAAADSHRPSGLVGILLAAPGSRGRFGIETSDLLGVTPQGDNTFALSDMARELHGVSVAQFVAGLDPMDDTDWSSTLSVPYRQFELPGLLHDMGGAGGEFQDALLQSIEWTIAQSQTMQTSNTSPLDPSPANQAPSNSGVHSNESHRPSPSA